MGEPRSVVVRKNGDILVADNQCNYMDVLDSRGQLRAKSSGRGSWSVKPKSKVQPRCMAQDSAGNVYIGVNGNDKEILVLTPDLKLKAQMGVESSGESKGVTGLWVDKDGPDIRHIRDGRMRASYTLGWKADTELRRARFGPG